MRRQKKSFRYKPYFFTRFPKPLLELFLRCHKVPMQPKSTRWLMPVSFQNSYQEAQWTLSHLDIYNQYQRFLTGIVLGIFKSIQMPWRQDV